MPNHYDIDIECSKCGRYICTIYPDDVREPTKRICEACCEKDKLNHRRQGIIDYILDRNTNK